MKNFAFEKQEIKTIPVSIENRVYQVKIDVKTWKAIEYYTTSMKPLIKKLHDNMSDMDIRKLNQDVARITERCLNDVFGKGAYVKIFANRPLNFADQCNLMSFLFEQMKEALE